VVILSQRVILDKNRNISTSQIIKKEEITLVQIIGVRRRQGNVYTEENSIYYYSNILKTDVTPINRQEYKTKRHYNNIFS